MAKLKFDRNLNSTLNSDENITVPNDEVWKGTVVFNESSTGYAKFNGVKIMGASSERVHSVFLGGVPAYWNPYIHWGCV